MITSHNPLPGANVMDHLTSLSRGARTLRTRCPGRCPPGSAHSAPDRWERLTVCGNPIQLSLFEGIEVRDLAYAGRNYLESRNIVPPTAAGTCSRGRRRGWTPR